MNDGYDSRLIRFGSFEADQETGELRKAGAKLPLQEQPFQVLVFFLQHPGELVRREQLRSRTRDGSRWKILAV